MKALFLTATEEMEIREAPEPGALAEEAIVDVDCSGLCGSDMHFWHGHYARRPPPVILGHETTGTVRGGARAGQRVAINPMTTCGACPACTRGDEHLCPTRKLVGVNSEGGFAEAVVVGEGCLTPIPESLSFHNAVLAEPLAVCVHAARVGFVRHVQSPEETEVAVLGGGAIGLLSAMAYRQMGVRKLWVAEPNAVRRKVLERILDARVYDPSGAGPAAGSVDMICDAVGSGRTREAATTLVRPGGIVVHVGLQDQEPGLDTRRVTLQEVTFVGTYCYRRDDFAEAVRLLAEGLVTGEGWTEVRPLEDGPQSFRDVDRGHAPPKIILVP